MAYDPDATRKKILGAALALFASDGYDKVTLRAIAAEAGMRLALLQYHFGTKEQLYRAVWEQRRQAVASSRVALLADVDFGRSTRHVLRQVLLSFVTPMLELGREPDADPGRGAFRTVIVRESVDPREAERGILAEFLDPLARQYMAAFGRVLPALSEQDIAWGYQMTVGALLLYIADTQRLTRLTDGRVKSHDAEAALPRMLDFLSAGWLALARKAEARAAGE